MSFHADLSSQHMLVGMSTGMMNYLQGKKKSVSMERTLATLLHLSGSLAVILTRAHHTCGDGDAQRDVIN